MAMTSMSRFGTAEDYWTPETDGGAIAALVFAIAAPLLPIWGWIAVGVLANRAEKRIRRFPDLLRGQQLVVAARLIIWTWFVLAMISLIVAVAVFLWVRSRTA